jgi:creatinine amidohydrolase
MPMDDTELYFANLSWPEIGKLRECGRRTVLLLPIGSTEPHGPHAPLCTDLVISEGVCVRVARRLADDPELRALILPSVNYAVTRFAGAFPGAVHVDEETLQAMVVSVCGSLIDQGFRTIVVVNNHFEPQHIQTLHRSLDAVAAEHGVIVGYLDLTRKERATRLTEEFRRAECHAGRYETSLVLADRPELVDGDAASALPYVPVDMAKAIAEGVTDFVGMGMDQAYCGSPAEATAGEGEESYAVLTDMVVELCRELVAGTGGRDVSGLYGRV